MTLKKKPEERMSPGKLAVIRRRAGKTRAKSPHQIKPWWQKSVSWHEAREMAQRGER